jgi:glycosyltransferase involved in cell wall biosynthesis
MHVPVDGEPFDSTLSTVAQMADLMIPASHYGKKICDLNNLPTCDVIPHAFDPKTYMPFKQTQRDVARSKFGFTDDLFVVGFVGRQQERKNLMALIIAFEKFARDKNDVRLLLNITIDKYSDFNLVHMVKFMGLGDKVLIVNTNNSSERDMATMYNALDMYISTSCSEGFDIPVLEAQACGVPCAVSDYSAHVELVKDHGKLIEIGDFRPMPNNIYWAYVNIDDTVASMQYYYDSINARRKDGAAALEFVKKYYTTDVVNKLWNNLITNYDDIKESAESVLPVRRMDINVKDE